MLGVVSVGVSLLSFVVSAVKLAEAVFAARKVPMLAAEKPTEPPSGYSGSL